MEGVFWEGKGLGWRVRGPTSVSVLSMIIYITHGGYIVYYFCFCGVVIVQDIGRSSAALILMVGEIFNHWSCLAYGLVLLFGSETLV